MAYSSSCKGATRWGLNNGNCLKMDEEQQERLDGTRKDRREQEGGEYFFFQVKTRGQEDLGGGSALQVVGSRKRESETEGWA